MSRKKKERLFEALENEDISCLVKEVSDFKLPLSDKILHHCKFYLKSNKMISEYFNQIYWMLSINSQERDSNGFVKFEINDDLEDIIITCKDEAFRISVKSFLDEKYSHGEFKLSDEAYKNLHGEVLLDSNLPDLLWERGIINDSDSYDFSLTRNTIFSEFRDYFEDTIDKLPGKPLKFIKALIACPRCVKNSNYRHFSEDDMKRVITKANIESVVDGIAKVFIEFEEDSTLHIIETETTVIDLDESYLYEVLSNIHDFYNSTPEMKEMRLKTV